MKKWLISLSLIFCTVANCFGKGVVPPEIPESMKKYEKKVMRRFRQLECWKKTVNPHILFVYYLQLTRDKDDKDTFQAPAIMAMTFTMNLLALAFLVAHQYIEWQYLFFGCFIFGIVLLISFQIIYSLKRTRKIKAKYEDESHETRRRGMVRVIIYEILSVVFLILVISITIPSK